MNTFRETLLILPEEIIYKILSKLDFKSLLSVNKTCKLINAITNRIIKKRTTFHFYYPFPRKNVILNLTREYETITLRYDDFIDELGSATKALKLLNYMNVKSVNLVINFMKMFHSEEFVEFMKQLPKLTQIRLIGRNASLESALNEFVNLIIIQDSEELEVGSVSRVSEIDFLNHFKEIQRVKCLSILNLETSSNPKTIKRMIESYKIDFDSVQELHLTCLKHLSGNPESLLLFRTLQKLVINDWFGDSDDLEFLQCIYKNNRKTLRNLEIDLESSNSFIIPLLSIFLKIERFRISYNKNYFQARPFIVDFFKQQGPTLKELVIQNIRIEQLPFSELSNLTTLDITMNHWFYILNGDLHEILSLEFSKTLEQLALRGIRSTEGSRSYKFPALKKLMFEGNLPFLFHSLEAPNLEHLMYSCGAKIPDFKVFPKLIVLFVNSVSFPLIELFGIIAHSVFLEVLGIEIEKYILEDVLNILWMFENLKFCNIICKDIDYQELKWICFNFIQKKDFKINVNNNGIKIFNDSVTIIVTNGISHFNDYYKQVQCSYQTL